MSNGVALSKQNKIGREGCITRVLIILEVIIIVCCLTKVLDDAYVRMAGMYAQRESRIWFVRGPT